MLGNILYITCNGARQLLTLHNVFIFFVFILARHIICQFILNWSTLILKFCCFTGQSVTQSQAWKGIMSNILWTLYLCLTETWHCQMVTHDRVTLNLFLRQNSICIIYVLKDVQKQLVNIILKLCLAYHVEVNIFVFNSKKVQFIIAYRSRLKVVQRRANYSYYISFDDLNSIFYFYFYFRPVS